METYAYPFIGKKAVSEITKVIFWQYWNLSG